MAKSTKASRWKRAGQVHYDDYATSVVWDINGLAVRVRWWLRVKRFIAGPIRG